MDNFKNVRALNRPVHMWWDSRIHTCLTDINRRKPIRTMHVRIRLWGGSLVCDWPRADLYEYYRIAVLSVSYNNNSII